MALLKEKTGTFIFLDGATIAFKDMTVPLPGLQQQW
jgi:hypothetical protein